MSFQLFQILFIFCIAFQLSTAQSSQFASQGFPGGEVTFLFEDQQGFIWVGSEQNLYRFDGISYQIFNSSELAIHATCMFQDREGQYWIGTEQGFIYHFRSEEVNLQLWEPEEGLPQSRITAIEQDNHGMTWIATYGEGVYVWQDQILYNFSEDDGLIDNDIYDLAVDGRGAVWVATDNGVNVCKYVNKKKHIERIDRSDGLIDEIVYELEPDAKGMWMGFDVGGYCHYSFEKGMISHVPANWSHGPVRSIQPTVFGTLLIANDEGEIFFVDPRINLKVTREEVSSTSQNATLLIDSEQNIWVGTDEEIYLAAGNLRMINHSLGDIQALLEDADGTLWTGTRQGLYQFKNDRFASFLPSKNIISLYEDAYQNLWIGTFGDGVFVFNKDQTITRTFNEREGLANGSVLSIAGNDEHIWLATLEGITEISIENNPVYQSSFSFANLNRTAGFQANFIYRIFIDSEDVVWIATDGNGVLKLEGDSIISLMDQKILPAKTAYCFAEDRLSDLWIGTAEDGLFRYDGENVSHFDQSDGLSSNAILGIEIDGENRVMAIHSTGIDLLDPDSRLVVRLGNAEGLKNLSPSLNSSYRTSYDKIWVGGDNTLVQYSPISSFRPRLVLDKVQSFDQLINQSSSGAFAWKNNFIQFDTKGLWYNDPEALSYRYRLEGNDPFWRESTYPLASYAGLAPGNYTFRIQPVLYGQSINDSELSYSFKIIPPIWRRAWVIALFCIGMAVSLYYYQKHRESNIQRKADSRRAQVESQFELLKAQINPHFLFNSFNTLATIVEEDTNLAIEYIEKLSDYYRSIIQSRNKKVAPLKEEIETIRDYYYLLKKRFGENLLLDISVPNDNGYLPLLSLQMLLENAIKHNTISKKHPLMISLTRDKDLLCMENNIQPKLTNTNSTHFGLQNLRNQYELLSTQEVSIINNGTSFSVIIPILKDSNEYINHRG